MGRSVEGGFEEFVRFEMSRGDVAADSGVFASAAPEAGMLTNLEVLQDYAGPGGDADISRRGIGDAAVEYNRWLERQTGEGRITEAELLRNSVVAVVVRRKETGVPVPEVEALWIRQRNLSSTWKIESLKVKSRVTA